MEILFSNGINQEKNQNIKPIMTLQVCTLSSFLINVVKPLHFGVGIVHCLLNLALLPVITPPLISNSNKLPVSYISCYLFSRVPVYQNSKVSHKESHVLLSMSL